MALSLYRIMAAVVAFSIVVNYLQAIYMRKLEGKFAIVANSEVYVACTQAANELFFQRSAAMVSRQGLNQSITSTLIGQLALQGLTFSH